MTELLTRSLAGGSIRFIESLLSAAPTLLVGVLIAGVFRYYLGHAGTRRLFGGTSLRSLPQSWAVGMLLPVCSIGVIPILIEMRRSKLKPGAISAFALSAPLFNPLSLLYGVTLSRPYVILMFAFASLVVVTMVGIIWDIVSRQKEATANDDTSQDRSDDDSIGLRRLWNLIAYVGRQLVGPVGAWTLIAAAGVALLAAVLPWGALGMAMERDDLRAPSTMAAVAIPAYATPMLAMSQLGMMFQHANSPGAAFVLLVIGAGVNLGTVSWMARHFGVRSVCIWLGSLLMIVLALAYAVNKPLVPPGVEPSGHTHAFDIYSNPIHPTITNYAQLAKQKLGEKFGLVEKICVSLFGILALAGLISRFVQNWPAPAPKAAGVEIGSEPLRFDRIVSPQIVGGTMLAGLIAISIVMCYAFYPSPEECLKEIRFIRSEVISAARSGDADHAEFWIPQWDEWTRRMEVGAFIRRGHVTPYQR
ncbi:MAG: permease, partial [Planctomycetota bacterium]